MMTKKKRTVYISLFLIIALVWLCVLIRNKKLSNKVREEARLESERLSLDAELKGFSDCHAQDCELRFPNGARAVREAKLKAAEVQQQK